MNIKGLCNLWKQTFGDSDDFLGDFFCVAFSPERCNTIEIDGNIAAMLYWFDCTWEDRKIAYLYAVATHEAYRNQGLCRALMEDTHTRLQNLGYHGAVLVPGSRELFALYEKFGYKPFCQMQTQTVDAGTKSMDLAKLRHAEYSARRPDFLPPNSILQDALTFAFLATFCDFYVCHNCLFCGAMDEDTFYFQEFFGDPECVPAILKSLGAKKGVLRTPGDSPFAMYLSFHKETALPTYFGIPLN